MPQIDLLTAGMFSFTALVFYLAGFKAGYSTATKELKAKLGFRFRAPGDGDY